MRYLEVASPIMLPVLFILLAKFEKEKFELSIALGLPDILLPIWLINPRSVHYRAFFSTICPVAGITFFL